MQYSSLILGFIKSVSTNLDRFLYENEKKNVTEATESARCKCAMDRGKSLLENKIITCESCETSSNDIY